MPQPPYQPPSIPPRPDGSAASILTLTQAFHEWVHALERKGWDIADASRGKPSYPADRDALAAMQAMLAGITVVSAYGTHPLGEWRYRSQAAEGFAREYGLDIDPESVAFTPGGQFGLAGAFGVVQQDNEGVILAAQPWYLNHEELSALNAGMARGASRFKPVCVDEKTLRLSAEALAKAAEGETIAAFLFCNPANPTGMVLRKAEWQEIAQVLRRYPDTPILLDEAFAEIVFDGDFACSLLHAAPDLLDRTFLFRSGTKALGLAGERLAAMLVPPRWRDAYTAWQSRLLGAPPLSSQAGMAAALAGMHARKKGYISEYYAGHAKLMADGLEREGLLVQRPEGGFFLLADFSRLLGRKLPGEAAKLLGHDSMQNDIDIAFALMLGLGQDQNDVPRAGGGPLRAEGLNASTGSPLSRGTKRGVATIPASCFGWKAEAGWLRVSFSMGRGEVEQALQRLLAAAR